MPRNIEWLILFFVLGFAVLGSSYYLHSSKNSETPDSQSQSEKDFLDFVSQKKELPSTGEDVSLVAVGDISYSRGVERIVKKQKDINYPFLKIRDYLKNADIVFGNLETPITKGREISDFEMVFRSNPGTEQALKEAGFSVLSLANNHTPNFGEQGLSDTVSYLDSSGIKHVGAGINEQEAAKPAYIETKGIKLAFLGYNDTDVVPASYEASEARAGTAFMRLEKMSKVVRKTKQETNFVIVSMHSGTEYAAKPNNSQINFAHSAIDAGADLVIGHHPHVVQTMEKYKGKLIFYSLGNFVFDQPQRQATKEGLVIKVYFAKNGISKVALLPVVMKVLAQPEAASGDEKEKILQRLNFAFDKRRTYYFDSDQANYQKSSEATIYLETPV